VHGWGMRVARGLVVLVVAAVCWALFVTDQHMDTGRMGTLVVRDPHLAGIRPKPVAERTLPASASTVSVIRTAERRDPAHTGIYEIGWEATGANPASTNVGLLVQLVPDTATARTVLTDVHRQYGASRSGDTYTQTASFTVAGVGGARGITYAISGSGSTGGGTAQVVSFRVGQVVVLELVQTTTGSFGAPQAAALARREAAHLRAVGTDLSLVVTTHPLGWSIALAAGSVVAAAAAVVLPEWFLDRHERRRRRAERRAEARARAERLARGRRSVRRHRAPAWQRRRTGAGRPGRS
jgi:hypothetical protein